MSIFSRPRTDLLPVPFQAALRPHSIRPICRCLTPSTCPQSNDDKYITVPTVWLLQYIATVLSPQPPLRVDSDQRSAVTNDFFCYCPPPSPIWNCACHLRASVDATNPSSLFARCFFFPRRLHLATTLNSNPLVCTVTCSSENSGRPRPGQLEDQPPAGNDCDPSPCRKPKWTLISFRLKLRVR
jgi:hypothetical protein